MKLHMAMTIGSGTLVLHHKKIGFKRYKMKNADLVKEWTVLKNTENNMRCYFYGSYEDFLNENCEEDEQHLWEEVVFDNWTSEDLVEIFRNDLEDANEHNWIWLPISLLGCLKYNNISEKECFDIIAEIYISWLAY